MFEKLKQPELNYLATLENRRNRRGPVSKEISATLANPKVGTFVLRHSSSEQYTCPGKKKKKELVIQNLGMEDLKNGNESCANAPVYACSVYIRRP